MADTMGGRGGNVNDMADTTVVDGRRRGSQAYNRRKGEKANSKAAGNDDHEGQG